MKTKLFFGVLLFSFLLINQTDAQNLQRRVLVEEFTSSTCGPCASLNTYFNPWLTSVKDQVAVIKYQMNWPGAGDPYYIADCGTRRTFYGGINSVPTPLVAGEIKNAQTGWTYQRWVDSINIAFTRAYALPSKADITGSFKMNGTTINVETTVTPTITENGYSIFVAVCEKVTTKNKMGNGESEFHHVLMKMLPNGSGTSANLVSGTPIPLSFTYNMSTTNVEEMDDLEVIVFIQKTSAPKTAIHAVYLEDTTPSGPENVEALQEEGLNIKITWQPPTMKATIDGYNIYRDREKLNTSLITTLSYDDVVPKYGVTYQYAVAAVVDGIESYYSYDEVITMVNIPKPTDVVAEQPTLNDLQMKISWEMAETEFPISGYNLYRNNSKINSALITETSYINKGASFMEYCFTVEAVVEELQSEKSDAGCVNLIKIPAPKNFSIEQSNINELKVNLTWDEVTDIDVQGYNIYRDEQKVNANIISGNSYQDEVEKFDQIYCYKLKAVYQDTEGDASSERCIRLYAEIPVPTGVQAKQIAVNPLTVSINWDKAPITVEGYNVYREDEKINESLITETSAQDIVPQTGTYNYTVAMVMGGVEGEKSFPATVVVKDDVSIEDTDLNKLITIYPNPATDILYLKGDAMIHNYQIFDIQGRLIHSSDVYEQEISTSQWNSGIYILRITTDKGIVNKRFMKK